MTKLSAYQKLKARNQELTQDIYIILKEKDPLKSFQVRFKWNMKFDMEEMVWAGDSQTRK